MTLTRKSSSVKIFSREKTGRAASPKLKAGCQIQREKTHELLTQLKFITEGVPFCLDTLKATEISHQS